MVTEIIETGRTVDEAISSACHKLGYELEHCDFEIIDFPKRGFLGLKVIPAKVRVSLKEEVVQARQPKEEEPAQRQERRAPQPPRPETKEKKKPKRAQHSKPKESKPVKVVQTQAGEKGILPDFNEADLTDEARAKASAATAYLEGIFQQFHLTDVEIRQIWEEGGVCLSVQGSSLGAVIGRRGETLDALQYLSGLVANRMEGDYLRITVDCGDYRVKRRATLEALAHRVSEQVLKTDTSKTLEPMNPFERRIIHATVSTIEGVSSTSVGEEPSRRVVITTPTAKSGRRSARPSAGRSARSERPERSGSGRGGRDKDKGRERDRDRSSSERPIEGKGMRERAQAFQPAREPDAPPSEAADQPLYGKIDLE